MCSWIWFHSSPLLLLNHCAKLFYEINTKEPLCVYITNHLAPNAGEHNFHSIYSISLSTQWSSSASFSSLSFSSSCFSFSLSLFVLALALFLFVSKKNQVHLYSTPTQYKKINIFYIIFFVHFCSFFLFYLFKKRCLFYTFCILCRCCLNVFNWCTHNLYSFARLRTVILCKLCKFFFKKKPKKINLYVIVQVICTLDTVCLQKIQ